MSVHFEVQKRRFLGLKSMLDFVSVLFSGGGPVGDYAEFEVIAKEGGQQVRIPANSRDHAERVVAHLRGVDDLTLDDVRSRRHSLRSDSF